MKEVSNAIVIGSYGRLRIFFTSPTIAKVNCDYTSTITKDIMECVTQQYEKVDKNLNEQYSKMAAPHGFPDRGALLTSERAWVKYRDAYCKNIRESTLPGEEAEIEKLGCLISLTSSRLVELFNLDTGVSGDGFYKTLSFTSTMFSKNREEILLYIESLKKLPEEVDYYEKNCDLTRMVHGEDERLCRARLKFQSM